MQKLTAQLTRLYLPADPAGGADTTRVIAIPFQRQRDSAEALHWERLCETANALQSQLGMPAPAVSIDGDQRFYLWLALEQPTPLAEARAFVAALHAAHFSDLLLAPDAGLAPALPPCLNQATDKWAAFIHPGMGASFAAEAGLEMAPPEAGQAAFLEGLHAAGAEQFAQAMRRLQPAAPAAVAATAPASLQATHAAIDDSLLLLKDATLEDIVRHLHAQNIEPTFRHLLP
jgi:hypothetical protein